MKLKFYLNMLMLSFVMAAHSSAMQNAYGSELDLPANGDTSANGGISPSAAARQAEKIVVSAKDIQTMHDGEKCPGAEAIKVHYTTRRVDFNAAPARDAETLGSTAAIIDCLSNPKMLARRLANMKAKEIMVKAVMATAFIHGGQKKIENPVQKGDYRYAHYLVLERIESLSILLSKELNLTDIDGNAYNDGAPFQVSISEVQWNEHNVIEALAKIDKDTFTRWFNEALVEHNDGLRAKAALAKAAKERETADVRGAGMPTVIEEMVGGASIHAADAQSSDPVNYAGINPTINILGNENILPISNSVDFSNDKYNSDPELNSNAYSSNKYSEFSFSAHNVCEALGYEDASQQQLLSVNGYGTGLIASTIIDAAKPESLGKEKTDTKHRKKVEITSSQNAGECNSIYTESDPLLPKKNNENKVKTCFDSFLHTLWRWVSCCC